MARLLTGIEGPFIGKVGTVIGSSWKGIPYIKSKPVKKRKARNKKIHPTQSRFAMAHYWLKPLLLFVREGFKDYSSTVEGFNAAKSHLIKLAIKEKDGEFMIDPSLVQLSFGDLPLPSHISVTKQKDNTLVFEWDTDSNGASPYDQVMVLAYDPKTGKANMLTTGQFRSVGKEELNVDGSPYHVYIAFNAHDRSRRSGTVYLGQY